MSTDQSHSDDRQSDLAVMDANEYKQKRRLQRILDAQDNVEEIANRAYERYTSGEISEDAKNIVLLRAVKQYVREVWNLLLEYDEHLSEEQWNQYLDGPPVGDDGREGDPLGGLRMEGDHDIYFWGLYDVLHAKTFYEDRWQELVESRHGPDEVVDRSASRTVPEDVTWNAYLLTRRFLSEEKDMEVRFEDMDDGLPSWGFFEVDEEQLPDTTDGAREVAADGDD